MLPLNVRRVWYIMLIGDNMDSEPSFKSMMKSVRTNGTGISNESFQKKRQFSPGGPSNSQAGNDWPEGSTYMNYPEGTPLPKSGPKVNTNLVNVPDVGENVGYATLAPKNDLTHGDVIDAVRHPSKKEDSEEEASEKTTPEITTPKKASASDPLLDAYSMTRYGQTFQKSEDCCDGGTPSVTKNPADVQDKEQDDDNKQDQVGVPGGIEPVNPNPVHSD